MVTKIVVVGHSQLAAVIESTEAQIVACPDDMHLREAVNMASSDGTPEHMIGLLFPWDVVPNCAQIAHQLLERNYKVVVFLDDPSVNPADFQGLPLATPDFSVEDLGVLMTSVMGARIFEAGTGGGYSSPQPQNETQNFDPTSNIVEVIDVGVGISEPAGNPWDQNIAETTQSMWDEQISPPFNEPMPPPMPTADESPQNQNPWDTPTPPQPQAPPQTFPPQQPQPQAPQQPQPQAPQQPQPQPQAPQQPSNAPWDNPTPAQQPQQPQPQQNPMGNIYESEQSNFTDSPWATSQLDNPPPVGPVPDVISFDFDRQSPQAPVRPDPFAPPPSQNQDFNQGSSAYDTSRSMSGYSPTPDPGPGQYRPAPRGKTAMVHTFAVPKGGTGKSSLAAIYAAVLALGLRADPKDPQSGPRVLLVDANVQQADSRRIMGLRPQRTILDLARTVYDENSIEAYLTPPAPGNPMWLLAGPLNKADADPNLVTPSVYRRATDILLTKFDHIIIDTPEARIFDPMLADYAMPITDWLIVPVIQNRPVLDGTKEWLQLIQAPRHVGGYAFESNKVRLVMNMAREAVGYKTEALSIDLATWEFAGEVAYSEKMAQATNEYRLPLDDKQLVESVRRVIYSVTGNTLFSPRTENQTKGRGKGKNKGKNKSNNQGSDATGGAMGFIKKMMS